MNNHLILSSSTKSYNSREQTKPKPRLCLLDPVSQNMVLQHAVIILVSMPIHVHMISSVLPLSDVSVLILLNINNLFSACISQVMGYDTKQMEAFLQEGACRGVTDPAAQQQTQAAVPQTTLLCAILSV